MKTIKLFAISLVLCLSVNSIWAQQETKDNVVKQKDTPAYMVAFVRVNDFETYNREYLEKATPLIIKYGGVPIAVSENPITLEGKLPEGKLVIVEFPSMQAAKAFYNDPEYQPLKEARKKVSSSDAVLLERGF